MYLVVHNYVYTFLAVMFLYLRVWGLLTTITIGPEGVRFKSPTAEYLYPWREIKAAGMYVQRNNIQVLQRHEFNRNSFLELKYVWFTFDVYKQPGYFASPDARYCDFEFRKDAWELFNKYLVGNPDPNKLPGFTPVVMGEPQQRNFFS